MGSKRSRRWDALRMAKGIGGGLAVLLVVGATSVWPQQRSAALMPSSSKQTNTPVIPSATRQPVQNDYIVSPDDLLEVYVFEQPEVSRDYRVSSNGMLTLPLLPEPISAVGLNLSQLSRLIETKFQAAGMLNNPQVTVSLRETKYHSVLVSGEVRTPRSYPVYGPTRLIDLLVDAGGITDAAGDDATITRGDVGAQADLEASAKTGAPNPSANVRSFDLNIRKLMQTGEDKASDILLYPGDRVLVQKAELIYILGAVSRPGGYVLNESRQHLTVLKALAMAGDVSGVAKKSRIIILRHDPGDPEDKRREIPVNYKAVVKGQIADTRLNPDDILFVPESGGVKAWHSTVNTAVGLAAAGGETLMIYH